MTAMLDFDRVLGSVLADDGPMAAPPDLVDAALLESAGLRQRRPRVAALDSRAWPTSARTLGYRRARRILSLAVVVALVLATLGLVLAVGRRVDPMPTFRNVFIPTGEIPGDLRSTWPVALADGRVLIVGGWPGSSNVASARAAILDPATGEFTPTGDMMSVHDNGVPVLLEDGRVLVIGGMVNGPDPDTGWNPPIATVEVFDPATGTFRATGSLSMPRFAMAVVRLDDGRVLVSGGATCLFPESCDPAEFAEIAEVYDPATERFTPTGPMTVPRVGHHAARLPDGRVLVVGGDFDTAEPLGQRLSSEIYDPRTGRFTPSATTTTAVREYRLVARDDEPPLLVGEAFERRPIVDENGEPVLDWRGRTQITEFLRPSVVERYDPATDRFEVIGALPYPAQVAVARTDGRIVVAGSISGGAAVGGDPAWAGIFDPATGLTEEIAPPRRVRAMTVTLPDGRVAFVGGEDPYTGVSMTDAEILE